ncbi:hypothetical protein, partial [Brachyspira sp.]|uniref:hypothetical protein n=1 Tax=Brachyspira sp. TaxID=1977261 RepID=UPI003D7D7A1E
LISLINKFYTKWIASGDAFAMTIKNNFAVLNNNVAFASACLDYCPPLVWQAHCVMQGVRQDYCPPLARRPVGKTPCYLTSITFDSLSRKIKNPCLVINNLFYRRNSMKNSKKLFLIVLSVLIVAFVSCKSNEDQKAVHQLSQFPLS